ncbi:MAG TPA: exodeoxyribonuclease VII small subunit [Ktedonobacterales bacterium]
MTTDRRRKSAASASAENGDQAQPLVFEEALGQLDAAVAALEGGQLPLDEALAIYEQGVRMARRCNELLDAAQLRVQRLSQSEDGFTLEPFEPDGE